MAPRETRIESGSYGRMSGAAAQRMLEARQSGGAPEQRRGPKQDKAPVAPGDAAASVKQTEAHAQAETLRQAARDGVPFAEECPRPAASQA